MSARVDPEEWRAEWRRLDPLTRRSIQSAVRHGQAVSDPRHALLAIALAQSWRRQELIGFPLTGLFVIVIEAIALARTSSNSGVFGIVWRVCASVMTLAILCWALFVGLRKQTRSERANQNLLTGQKPD